MRLAAALIGLSLFALILIPVLADLKAGNHLVIHQLVHRSSHANP